MPGKGKGDPHTFSQEVQLENLSARVPEKVARGTFSTGALVLQGATEFVLDFVLRMNQPHQVAARIILPVGLMPKFIDALKDNLEQYRQNFGPPMKIPTPPQPVHPSIEEIYQDLRIADEVLAGVYANTVMVVHTASDFCLEFISNFYPKAIIVARVFLSAPQVPVLLQTLTQSWQTYQAKLQQKPPPPPPPAS
jgi:hypothetical protein